MKEEGMGGACGTNGNKCIYKVSVEKSEGK
jgi:hypothetical protein